jgi:hypothetical protein
MRTRTFLILVVLAALCAVALVLGVAHATAYRKTGMTTAVCAAQAKNPNQVLFERGRTLGTWTCQDSFTVAAGDVYTFVPWRKDGATLKSMVGWRYQVLPYQGACEVTAFINGAAIGDRMRTRCGPDSALTMVSDGTRIDSLWIKGLVLCKGRVRAQ